MQDTELEQLYITINKLIKEEVIRFNYCGSNREPQLIQCLLNKVDTTIDLTFRDDMNEMLKEFKRITGE